MMGVNHVLKTCHAYHQSSCSCKKMEQSEMAKGNMEPSNYQHLFHMKRGGMVASQTIKHVIDLNASVQHPSAEISTFFFQPQDRPSHVASVATVDLLSHEGLKTCQRAKRIHQELLHI